MKTISWIYVKCLYVHTFGFSTIRQYGCICESTIPCYAVLEVISSIDVM